MVGKKDLIRKIVATGIIFLFIVSSVTGTIDDKKINDNYENLIQQSIKSGVISKDDWYEQDKLLASDGSSGNQFGFCVSLDGDYAIIGASEDDDNGQKSGSAYIFKRDGITWIEQAKIIPSDGAENDFFGQAVSIDGDYAIIGAYGDDDNGNDCGSAYIFKRDGITWIEQAKLIPLDSAAGDLFSWHSVSISGEYAIIGSKRDDDLGDSSGSAYIFKREGTTWIEDTKLLASDGGSSNSFGTAVSIISDYVIIGADFDDDNGWASGSAYVFKRSGTTWTEEAKLLASDGLGGDRFGSSCSIDGDNVIIGAYGDNDNGNYSGSAYIFTRDGTNWNEEAKLLPSDGEANDQFGHSVSINGDYAIIGAHLDDDYGGLSGSAYLYTSSDSIWTQQAKILASDGEVGDVFGRSVAINEDYMIIGASGDDDNGWASGSAYVFTNNQPPNTPIIDGPTNGKAGTSYDYDFTATDPNEDDVYYYIDWGDGETEEWIGTFESGEEVVVNHTWAEKDTYLIKAKAKDIFDAESEWGTLEVTMPVNQQSTPSLFLQFLERFPNAFPILRYLLGL